jgi:hypothetical protein
MDENTEPKFFGEAGGPVPEVDPEDLKAVWQLFKESRIGPTRATGMELIRAVCKTGTNVEAVSYRAMMLSMLIRHSKDELATWLEQDEPTDPIFIAAAQTPMDCLGVGIVHQGLPFDFEEFKRRVTA